jgi:hypothetical protein
LFCEFLFAVTLDGVEGGIEDEERNGCQCGNENLVADYGVTVPVDEDVRMKPLVFIDPERAVVDEAECGVMFSDDVGCEVDAVKNPGDQKNAPPGRF